MRKLSKEIKFFKTENNRRISVLYFNNIWLNQILAIFIKYIIFFL